MLRMRVLVALAGLTLTSATSQAQLLNGSFEAGTPNDVGGFTSVAAGNTSITNWTVGGAGVDWIGNYWQPSNGSRSIDLNGGSAGSLSQAVTLTVGQQYRVTFDMATNPAGVGTYTRDVQVSATGATPGTFSFTHTTQTTTNMGWQTMTYDFTATSASTTLSFDSLNTGTPYGPALDNVSLTPVPEPASVLAAAGGVLGLLRLRRRAA